MRHKKSDNKSDEESALEQRVDRMMDPHQPDDSVPQAPDKRDQENTDTPPPIDIFKDSATAPKVPAEVLEEMGLTDDDTAGKSDEAAPTEKASEETDTTPPPEKLLDTEATEPFSDRRTDEAVADIEVADSDKVLEVEDAELAAAFTAPQKKSFGQALKRALKKWWVWLIIILVILSGLYAVPFTRFHIAAQFVKQPFAVTVLDSVTHTPVSGAAVTLNGQRATSDAKGKVSFTVPVGHRTLSVQEKYYKNYSADVLVPLWSRGNQTVQLTATGRQVPVKVVNKLTGSPVSGAEVRVLDTKATTGKDGTAVIVLPTGKSALPGRVQATSYNTTAITLQVTNKTVPANTFELTPVGRAYFLSNSSGNPDVVSANLDGTDRLTVLAGTGNEDPNNTTLLASRDWKYLALESARSSQTPELFLIDTAHNNKLKTIDNSGADIAPIGWGGHYFVYSVTYGTMPQWQAGRQALKSFNADTGKVSILAQTQVTGTEGEYAYQTISNVIILDSEIFYTTQWNSSSSDPSDTLLAGKTDTLSTLQPDGTRQKDQKTFDAQTYGFLQAKLAQPGVVYISVRQQDGSAAYYQFANGAVSTSSDLTLSTYDKSYPAYLPSPSGGKTLWSEMQNSQMTILVGDKNGQNAKPIATLDSGYTAYGWYTDNYVLVMDKNGSLYILPAAELSGGRQPLLIG